ncbi:MAG: cysteine desulfurase [Bacteroidia bacterium]|nr:cysteine desulfurase [Bacteroidia bacterium]
MDRIYFDNAASTPMDESVFEAMKPYFCEFSGNPSSTHSHGRILKNAVEKSRKLIAGYLNAMPSEIFFTAGGTEADNTILCGAVSQYNIKAIVSTEIEHHAVTHTIEYLVKEKGVKSILLSVDKKGNINPEELSAVLAENPNALVSIMHANNEIGTLADIQEIGEICQEYNALFHSDTVQTIGHFPFDLQNTNVHYLTGSAHKFYGPKGIGFMYIKQGYPIPALIHGGSQERNMRSGTENVAGIVGMAHALEKCYSNLPEKEEKLWALKDYMKQQLTQHFPNVCFHGETEKGKSLSTILNSGFDLGGEERMLLFNLDIKGVSVSGGSACTSGSLIGSHVLAGIQADPVYAMNAIRFSFGIQNTKEEIDKTIEALKEIMYS